MIQVELKGKKQQFNPEEVSAMVLTKMKETAEAFLGCEVRPRLFGRGWVCVESWVCRLVLSSRLLSSTVECTMGSDDIHFILRHV